MLIMESYGQLYCTDTSAYIGYMLGEYLDNHCVKSCFTATISIETSVPKARLKGDGSLGSDPMLLRLLVVVGSCN